MPSDLRPGPDSPPADELRAAEASLGVLQHIVHPISPDDLSRPTPSGDFDVAQLTDHLVETITSIGEALDADLPPRDADDTVERQIIAVGRPTLDAFQRDTGWTAPSPGAANEVPVRILASVLASVCSCTGGTTPRASATRPMSPIRWRTTYWNWPRRSSLPERRANGEFGDPVEVDEHAPAIDRLVAFTGRDPAAKS